MLRLMERRALTTCPHADTTRASAGYRGLKSVPDAALLRQLTGQFRQMLLLTQAKAVGVVSGKLAVADSGAYGGSQ